MKIVHVRQANLKDMDALIKYRMELLRTVGNMKEDSDQEALMNSLRNYFTEHLGTQFYSWVAEIDHQIIAISGLNIFRKPPCFTNLEGLEGYIMNMYVSEEFRGQGLATQLMNTILAFLKEKDITHVRLVATEQGKPVYEKLGFYDYLGGMELHLE